MTRRIEFYARGGGAAAQALRDLGFEQDELAKLDTETQFYKITEAINSIESESRRAALAFEIFGDSGRAMTTLIGAGTDGINQMRERAQLLGHTLSREAIAGLEAYGDAADDSSRTMEAFSNHLAANMAPALTVLNQLFTDSIIEMGGMGKVGEAVAGALTSAIGFVGNSVQSLVKLWNVLRVAVQAFYVKVLELADGLGIPFQKVGELIHEHLTLRLRASLQALVYFTDFIGLEVSDSIQATIDKIDSYKPKDIVNSEYLDKQKQALNELKQVANESFEAANFSETFKDKIDEILSEIDRAKAQGESKDLAGSILGSTEDIKRRGDAILAEVNRYTSTADELRQQNYQRQLDELDDLIENDISRREEYAEARAALEEKHREEMREIAERDAEEKRVLAHKEMDENAKHADIIFGNNKVSALRQAMLSMQANIAKSSEIGFPQNLITIAAAVAQGLGIIKAINGVAHSGLDRVPNEGTYLLQKDEAVLKKQDADAYRRGELQGGGGEPSNITVNPTINSNGLDSETETQLINRLTMQIVSDIRGNGIVGQTIRSVSR